MNNEERKLWVMNDEGLYNWWRSQRVSMLRFITEHRVQIDAYISEAMTGKR